MSRETYNCPACGRRDVAGQAQCRCGADLTILCMFDAAVDGWFNRGLAAATRGAPAEALEWFSACCAARPADLEARLAQAKCWAVLGQTGQARAALAKAMKIDPDNQEAAMLAAALEQPGEAHQDRPPD